MTPLFGCFQKVKRAGDQIEVLNREGKPVKSAAEFNGYQAQSRIEPVTGDRIVEWQIEYRLLVRWGIIAGEIAHDFRSALDQAVCALVRRSVPDSDCSKTYFPIYTTPLDPGKHRKELHGLNDPKAEEIIEAVQPHMFGDAAKIHPLWLLHELNNWDKHRAIQISVIDIGFPVDSAIPLESAIKSIDRIRRLVRRGTVTEDKTPVFWHQVQIPADLQMHGNVRLDITFQGPGPMEGRSLVGTFNVMLLSVTDVLTRLEPLFPHDDTAVEGIVAQI